MKNNENYDNLPLFQKMDIALRDLTVSDLLKEFLSGKSEKTVKAYAQDLDGFRKFLNLSTIDEACKCLLSQEQGKANYLVLQFKNHLMAEEKSPATINRKLASLRSCVKMARVMGMVSWALDISNVSSKAYRDTRGPGKKAIKAMVNIARKNRNRSKALRDVAIIHLLYDLALRRNEVCSLDLENIEIGEGEEHQENRIAVMSKGKRELEYLGLPDSTAKILKAWINVRGSDEGPLFRNFDRSNKGKSTRMSGRAIHYLISGYAKRVGLKTHPHGLRHTAITQAVIKAQYAGIGLEEILDYSRHVNLSTLMIYRDHERNVQKAVAQLVSEELED